MYTVEFEKDASVITSLDETNKFEDVEMIIADDDTVYIRQFDEALDQYQMVYMSYQQLLDLSSALQSPEGAFYARLIQGNRP
jgi:hypothetical protein